MNAEAKTKHLLELNGASERLTLFQSDLTAADSFEKVTTICSAEHGIFENSMEKSKICTFLDLS